MLCTLQTLIHKCFRGNARSLTPNEVVYNLKRPHRASRNMRCIFGADLSPRDCASSPTWKTGGCTRVLTFHYRRHAEELSFKRPTQVRRLLAWHLPPFSQGYICPCRKLNGTSPTGKLPQSFKESTFVHRIFGGRLRSRVLCLRCKHPSDTFETFLDLSLDIARADDVSESLEAFVKKDRLTGSNRYQCERYVFTASGVLVAPEANAHEANQLQGCCRRPKELQH
jgi:hypothetical protein